MIAVALRGMATRRMRALLTALAIALGTAMIAGTLVLTDTIMRAYSDIFTGAYVHTDAVVVATSPFGATGTSKEPLPAALLDRIRALPQVQRAHGVIDDHAQLVAPDGAALGGSGAGDETLAFGIASSELDAMNPLTLASGRWATGPGEVTVDAATAAHSHLHLGQQVGLVARTPLRPFRLVGTFHFAGAANLGPVQMIALDLPIAQQLLDKPGKVDEIDVAARPGTGPAELVSALRAALPATATVRTASQQASAATGDIGTQIDLIRYVLLAFGAIALFVGGFIIVNTLSITIGQRTRELATLRMLGATRRQVRASILLEGLVLGALASAGGLALGLGFAKGLSALFSAGGINLPSAGTVISWPTIAIALATGTGATLLASLAPARRATRTEPLRAFAGDDATPVGSTTGGRIALLVVPAAGLALTVAAAVSSGLGMTARLGMLGGGALLACLGLPRLGRRAVPPLVGGLALPVRRLAGTPADLARDNSIRNPARTAITAASLTIATALILLTATLSGGIRGAIGTCIRQQTRADYVITPNRDVLTPRLQQALSRAGIPATGVRSGTGHTLGANQPISGIDPTGIAAAYTFRWADGSTASALTGLDRTGALLDSDFATAHRLRVGSPLAVQTPTGTVLHLVVRGIYRTPKPAPLLGTITIAQQTFDTAYGTPGDARIYLTHTRGTDLPQVRALLKAYPTSRLDTLAGFITTRQATVATAANLFYVLLGLAVLISLLGVVNTLTLSITERTREIGILRAIGTTRRQLRRMIRIESQLTAITGALLGIPLGLALAALATQALSGWAVTLNPPWLLVLLTPIAAGIVGTVAGLPAARRAARLDPLAALSYE